MVGGRSALAVVLGTGLLVGVLAPRAGAAVVVSPSSLQRYREAHVALAGGEYARARTLLDELPPEFLLADHAAFFAAEAVLRGGDEPLAVTRYRAFTERFPDSLLWPQAQLATLDTAFRLGLWADAEREARRFLARAPAHPEAGRVLVRLAEARAAQGQVAEAIADLRRRWIEAPASAWGEAARESLEDLAKGAGLPVAPLTIEEQFLQAQRLADAGEQSASVRLLESLLAQGPELPVRHRALARMAPMLGRLARSDEAIARLDAALTEPVTPSRAALLYELGRLLQRSGQTGRGAAMYERLLAEHPDAPNLAEATIQLARARAELGQFDAAREAFQRVVARYPDSATAASARWEVAWLEYRDRPAPRGRPRVPPDLDHGRERAAGRALLGGPLARPARGEGSGPGPLSRGAEPRPARVLRHPRRAPRAGEGAAPGRAAREAHGGSGRPAPARRALPAGARPRLDRVRRVRHPGARGARPGRGRGQRSRLGARGGLRRSRGGGAEPPLPAPGARPGRGGGGAGAPAAPLAALLSPRVRGPRPRRGPHGGARPVHRRGRDPRGVLLRSPRALRRRGDGPDAAHARHRASGGAGARAGPSRRSPPCGSRR